jgi:hypothetical protein
MKLFALMECTTIELVEGLGFEYGEGNNFFKVIFELKACLFPHDIDGHLDVIEFWVEFIVLSEMIL